MRSTDSWAAAVAKRDRYGALKIRNCHLFFPKKKKKLNRKKKKKKLPRVWKANPEIYKLQPIQLEGAEYPFSQYILLIYPTNIF
jgi:hypothetical protein